MVASESVLAEPAEDRVRLQVRVLVAEARAMAADAMARAITRAQDLRIVARCADRSEVVASAVATLPDVAVLDVSLYGYEPYDGVRSLREHAPNVKALLSLPVLDVETVAQALLAGATNCVSAAADQAEFVRAIRATSRDELVVPDGLDARLSRVVCELRADHTRLSPREVEVLRLAAEGLSVADIASRLYVSENTARTHLKNLYQKLGVHNRSGAVAAAMRHGFIR
jgi:DNA-binding NarL/FixJ family response regulator